MTTAITNANLLANDSVLPHRDELLDTSFMLENLRSMSDRNLDSCEIVRVKYRPSTSLRVLYRLKTGSVSTLLAARSFIKGSSARVFNKLRNPNPVFYDEKISTAFWEFPLDRKIKNLNILLRIPQELKNIGNHRWKESNLVGYAPEKCAVAKCMNSEGKTFAFAKIFAGREIRQTFLIYDRTYYRTPEPSRFRFPKVVHYSDYFQTLFIEAIEGTRLADVEAQKRKRGFCIFGEAIAHLHNARPLEFLSEFARLKPKKILKTLEIISRTRPENFVQAKSLGNRLTKTFAFDNKEKVSLHGDIHGKNAILRNDGRLTLIDLDQMSVGNASADIGSFFGALFYKECIGEISIEFRKELIESFLYGYEKIRKLPTRKSLEWHTASALLTERSARAINRFRINGLEKFSQILTIGEDILDGGQL